MIGDSNNPKTSRNPAFAALGLPQLKLPSKPWIAFWTIVSTMAGGVIYDKWEQRKLRAQYQEWAQMNSGNKILDVKERPRLIRIYIAPFPNDYLAESLKYLKRFVKPILNAGGIDLKIVTMERQGDIRYKVAEEIRELRRQKAGLPSKLTDIKHQDEEISQENNNKGEKSNTNTLNPVFSSIVSNRMGDGDKNNNDPPQETKSRHDLYTPMDVVSVKSMFNFETPVKYDDALVEDVRDAGGIICIGRGAFKEYINGVHEGLLGPLYPPNEDNGLSEELTLEKEEVTINQVDLPKNQESDQKKEEAVVAVDDKNNDYAPAPLITFDQYSKCDLAPELPELSNIQNCKDENGVPYFFVQPILELRNWSVSGFTRQLERMWRFYNKRNQLIEYNEQIKGLMNKEWHSMMDQRDEGLNIGEEEENDWPRSWKKSAIEKNSEWVREFGGDSRVLELLSSYNVKRK